MLKEHTIDGIREKEYPDKPSRMDSVFCCPSLEDAKQFDIQHGRRYDCLYRVKRVDDSNIHIGDFNIFNIPTSNPQDAQNQAFLNLPALPHLEKSAHKYWSFEPSVNREILISGSIEVIELLKR